MLKKIINILLPNHCMLCQNNTHRSISLCVHCEKELPWNDKACRCCGKYIEKSSTTLCGKCLAQPPPYRHTVAAFRYQPPVSDWISAIKFYNKWYYTQMLGKLFAKRLLQTRSKEKWPELIIPVPLHHKRLRKRGFNQALEIAKPIAKAFNIPIDTQSIQRIKNTLPQSELSKASRQKNIKKAFHLGKPIIANHIAIFDDVITTGNTITELSQALKHHGVKTIEVWCCARAQE